MKLYLDTVNIGEIEKYCDVIEGVTTVPTFAVQENITYNEELIMAIKEVIGLKEIHFTILEQRIDKAVAYCTQLEDICGCNVIFKIPISLNGIRLGRQLHRRGLKTGIHLVFNPNQVLLALKALPDYIYFLIGKQDDIGYCGIEGLKAACKISGQIIATSIRHPMHVTEAARAGVYGVSVPPAVLEKMFAHPLTEAGIKKFEEDWIKCRGQIE